MWWSGMIRDHSDLIVTLGDSTGLRFPTGLRFSSSKKFASSSTCIAGKISCFKFKKSN